MKILEFLAIVIAGIALWAALFLGAVMIANLYGPPFIPSPDPNSPVCPCP